MQRPYRQQAPDGLYREERKAKKEEDRRARKKTQKTIEMKPVEEDQGRRNTTFKPPGLRDFQNAADNSAIGGLQFDPLGVVGVAKLLVDGVGLGAFGLPAGLRGAQ